MDPTKGLKGFYSQKSQPTPPLKTHSSSHSRTVSRNPTPNHGAHGKGVKSGKVTNHSNATTNPSLLKHFRGHRDSILGLDFHPNLPQLVSCGADEHVTIWNYKQDTRALRYEGHKGHVYDVQFSKNGDLMVTGGEDETIRLWVPTVKGEVRSFKGHSSKVKSVCFSPSNPSIIASSSNDKTVKLWSLDHRSATTTSSSHRNKVGSFIKSFYNIHTNWIRSVRFSPDGNLLVTASEDKSICLLDVRSYECVAKIQSHLGTPLFTDFNPCASHYIGSSTSDQCFTIHDLRKSSDGGALVQVYQKLQKGAINSFAYHPSGDYAVTVAADATIKILDLVEGRPIYTLHGPREALYAVTFSKDGQLLATAGKDRELLIWEPFLIPYDGKDSTDDDDGKENQSQASVTNLTGSKLNSATSSPTGTLSNLSRSSTPASASQSHPLQNDLSESASGRERDSDES